MLVLGVDASLTRSAFVMYDSDARTYRYQIVASSAAKPLGQRLRRLSDAAYDCCSQWGVPALVVLEEPGFLPRHMSVGATFSIGRAQGAIIAGLASSAPCVLVTVAEYRRDLGIHMRSGAGKQPVLDYLNLLKLAPPKGLGGRYDDDVGDG